ncbi:MAG: hypothetical protein ACRERD_29995 [Candidatus Binatia bacterium]
MDRGITMRPLVIVRGSVILLTLLLSVSAWADAFTKFFYQQKIGQELTVTGRFGRLSQALSFFESNHKTGDDANFKYFSTTVFPTIILGNGSLAWPPKRLETVLFLYPDEGLVKDLPTQGDNLWFTGTLIGYQYGTAGITSDVGTGGAPYILLKRISTQPPEKVTLPQLPQVQNVPLPAQ